MDLLCAARNKPPMMAKTKDTSVDDLRAVIREAIRLSEHTATSLGMAVGDKSHVTDFLSGRKRSLKPEALMTINAELRLPFGYLLGGWKHTPLTEAINTVPSPAEMWRELEPMVEKANRRRLRIAPVIGETAAGVWLEFEQVHEHEHAQIPYVPDRYPDLDQFAFKVRGRSMIGKDIYDGDYVICVEYSIVRAIPAPGDIVVAERRRGGMTERTCKFVERSGAGLVLVSKSPDPEFQEPVPLGDDETEVEIMGLVVGKYRPFL